MAVVQRLETVTWRQAVASVVVVGMALTCLVLVLRADGLPAVNAASSRATRWVVHQPSGRAVLVDGFGGRPIASLELEEQLGNEVFVAEGAGAAYLLDDSSGQMRPIDSAELRLGPRQVIPSLGVGVAVARAGPSGLLVANPREGQATWLPANAETVAVPFEADNAPGTDTTETVALAPDGSIWSLVDGDLQRATPAGTTTRAIDVDDATLSLVGSDPVVLDRDGPRVRVGGGEWVDLPRDAQSADGDQFVVQRPGPQADCAWVGGGDDLYCVSDDGIDETAEVPDLGIDGGDVLAIAGDAAALVRRGPTEVVQFDWRTEEILDDEPLDVDADAQLDVSATTDVIWIDDRSGDFVSTVHPWGIEVVDKDASDVLVLGEEGAVIRDGEADRGDVPGADDGSTSEPEEREPDDDGEDDPPVAIDDPVTARAGASVPVAVTANDYDPDGEAIAVVDAGAPGHGSVEVGSASIVVYTPEPGYVGRDEFDYTIADGDGTEASATVIVDLLPVDGQNQPPVGTPDTAQTGPGTSVIVDVLLNDVDPERDGLRLDSFSAEPEIGQVNETEGPSGLPALEYTPEPGFEGEATFSYQPADAFGAVGEPVTVTVEVARVGDANRPPIVRPDSVRTRRNNAAPVPVLVNDSDPDGDKLALSVVTPLPDALDVDVRAEQLVVTPRAGSGDQVSFQYEVDDGQGNQVRGSVLVNVIDENEPNRPPVVSADLETVVVGQTILIDVTANDSDPDNDPLAIVDVSQPTSGGAARNAGRNQIEFTPTAIDDDRKSNVRFTYTVSDGNGHEVVGDVTVTVLAEPLPAQPYARDDSTFTFVDQAVTIDVLRNDGDPSGGRPTIVGTPGCPSGGTATVTDDGKVRYNPQRGRSGAFRCTYEVTNSQNLRDFADIIISVREPELTNEPPRVSDETINLGVGETRRIDVTANATDPDGVDSALRVTSSTTPSAGTASRDGNVITYTAGASPGAATISFTIADAEGAITSAKLLFVFTEAENLPPVARPDSRQMAAPGFATTIDVLSNDFDPDDSPGLLRVTSAQLATGDGTLRLSGSTVTITPAATFVGVITGTYTITDGEGLTASSTVTLTITEPANRAPVALDDGASVANGGSVTVSVLANDTDPDGDPLTLAITSAPDANLGSASVNGNQIAFSARPGQSGVATIGYQVSDGEFTDTATLRITVASCQASQPVANDDFLTTGYRQPIAVNLANYAANGDIVNVSGPPGYANGVYDPPAGQNGNVTISFSVRNQCDQTATGTITIDVNQSPNGQNFARNATRNETFQIPVSSLGSDNEALSISSSNGAPSWVATSPGALTVNVPAGAEFGTYTWTTTIVDPGNLTATSTISITVTNGKPTAAPDSINAAGGAGSTDLLANDSDPDGGALSIQSIPATMSFPNGGTGTITRSGGLVTVTTTDGTGTGTFTYTVIDDGGSVSSPATVTVTGPPVATTTTTTTTTTTSTTTSSTTTTTTEPPSNTAPVAGNQNITVTVGSTASLALNVSDADGDQLTVIEIEAPGGVTANASGLTMNISASSPGSFEIRYRVTDGTDASNRGKITVNANAATTVPPPPPTTTTPPPPPPTEPPPSEPATT